MTFRWKELMECWNTAIWDSRLFQEFPEEFSDEARTTRWLGYPGATEEQIQAAERRLGTPLPPSYREFLKFSNGWSMLSWLVPRLPAVEEINWYRIQDPESLESCEKYFDTMDEMDEDDMLPDDFELAEADPGFEMVSSHVTTDEGIPICPQYLYAALDVGAGWEGYDVNFIVQPYRTTPEGDWEAWVLSYWNVTTERHRSFWDLMQAEYRSFLLTKDGV